MYSSAVVLCYNVNIFLFLQAATDMTVISYKRHQALHTVLFPLFRDATDYAFAHHLEFLAFTHCVCTYTHIQQA